MSEQQQNQQQFAVQRIYIKDASYESPMGVKGFQQNWKPQVNQDINTRTSKVGDNTYEVVLTVTVTVKLGEEGKEETAFIVEVQQAGIFSIVGLDETQLRHVMGTHCPTILFPYARETVDSMITKGSFPALMLPPINFDALYQQVMAQQTGKADGNPH